MLVLSVLININDKEYYCNRPSNNDINNADMIDTRKSQNEASISSFLCPFTVYLPTAELPTQQNAPKQH